MTAAVILLLLDIILLLLDIITAAAAATVVWIASVWIANTLLVGCRETTYLCDSLFVVLVSPYSNYTLVLLQWILWLYILLLSAYVCYKRRVTTRYANALWINLRLVVTIVWINYRRSSVSNAADALKKAKLKLDSTKVKSPSISKIE